MAKAEYRSSIRSKQLINAALADLLQEKPLNKITVTDVVRRAGINRGTFYAHYMDISDVIQHLIDKTFLHIRDNVFEHPNPRSDYPLALLQRIQMILEEDITFYQKIMNSSASSLMQEKLMETMLEYMIQREKELGLGNHEQYVLTLHFCAGGLTSLYRQWFAGSIPVSLDELTERAARMLQKILETA